MKYIIILFFALTLTAFAEEHKQETPPTCTESHYGEVFCMAGRMCECTYERGGEMTGRPKGYKWDCSITRPNCPKPEKTETYNGPDSVSIDKSTTTQTNN